MKTTPEIAVVGAGIAGLSCARRLQAAGINVTVIDKSRGPAGRMSTRRGDDWQCDHGAQYFTARHPLFRAEVERWLKAGVAALWQPRLDVIGDREAHVPDAALSRYVGVPRMTAPARWLADAVELVTQATVHTLRRENKRWTITTHEHGPLPQTFTGIVMAVPAPQAVPLLQGPAPDLADVARQANMRACWAMMLQYDAPVDLPFDAAFVNEGPLRWVARNSSKPGRAGAETWLLHATAEWSEANIEATPDTVASAMQYAFMALGARPARGWAVHRWRYADTQPPLQHGAIWDNDIGIGLCGDWLNGGKVEGAWLSGNKVAEALLVSLGQDLK